MSSMDKVFVKAFSRRNRVAQNQSVAPEVVEPPETSYPNGELGSLQVDRSVAGTAEVWVDPIEDQIARADYASTNVPRPHVEPIETLESPQIPVGDNLATVDRLNAPQDGVETEHEGVDPFDEIPVKIDETPEEKVESAAENHDVPAENAGPLSHIHTAYAGSFADPSLLAAAMPLDEIVDSVAAGECPAATIDDPVETADLPGLGIDTIAQIANWAEAGQQVAAEQKMAAEEQVVAEQVAETIDEVRTPRTIEFSDEQPLQVEHSQPIVEPAIEETPVEVPVELPAVELPADSAQSAITSDASSTYVPFQAVWEVDVFDVPTHVADLFFEGALFQQIAERMSDAVGSGLKNVLVTSTKPGEGRSSVAIGMAMAAAAAGIRVALVDADAESPTLADELRLDLQYGWVDVIRRGLPIKEIAVHAVEDGVTLIPLMPPGASPAATAFEMVQLIDRLSNNFELVILDGPTSLSPGLHQCATKVDSAVIVRDVNCTDTLAVSELSNRLHGSGVRGIGMVENFV